MPIGGCSTRSNPTGEIVLAEIFEEVNEDWQTGLSEEQRASVDDATFDARKRLRKAKAVAAQAVGRGSGEASAWWTGSVHHRRRANRGCGAAGWQEMRRCTSNSAAVRRPAELSKLVGVDVRSFRHAVSNQAMAHALRQHGSATVEAARAEGDISG